MEILLWVSTKARYCLQLLLLLFSYCCFSSPSLAVGHGADVKCCDWHPRKSLLVSGSKDNQQPVKVWDSRTGQSICTMSVRDSVAVSMSVHLRILCQLIHLSLLLHYYMYQHCCVLMLSTNNFYLDTLDLATIYPSSVSYKGLQYKPKLQFLLLLASLALCPTLQNKVLSRSQSLWKSVPVSDHSSSVDV